MLYAINKIKYLLFILGFFIFPVFAFAFQDTQPDYSIKTLEGYRGNPYADLGQGEVNKSITGVTVMSNVYNATCCGGFVYQTPMPRVFECDYPYSAGDPTNGCFVEINRTGPLTQINNDEWYLPLNPTNLNPNKYYRIRWDIAWYDNYFWGNGTIPYWKFSGAGFLPENTETRLIEWNTPIQGQQFTDTTTQIDFSFDFYNGTTTPVEYLEVLFNNPEIIGVEYSYIFATSTIESGQKTYTGNINIPINGEYNTTVVGWYPLWNDTWQGATFSIGATSSKDIVGIDLNNPYGVLSDLGYATTTCGITSGEKIQACVIQAGMALFWPSASSTNRIKSIGGLLEKKAPLGYFFKIKESMTTISTSTSPVFNLSIPQGVKDIIFTPLKIGIAGILWFFFLIHFYHRVRTLNIW